LTPFAGVLKPRTASASLWAVDSRAVEELKNIPHLLLAAVVLLAGPAHAQTRCCAPPQTPEEALFRSIENGDLAEFSRLLDAGASLSAKNRLGETPLYVAAEKGEIEMARLLIAKGADARTRTPNGETVLHAAAMIESAVLTTELIRAGAEVNAVNQDGETALQWAALTGTFLAVKALADAGADLNVQDARLGNTALHAAVSHDDIVLIHYLLSKSVRTDIRNNQGQTAFELAQSRGRASVKLFETQDAPRP
jgi:ankyrin repeat protein